MEKLKVFIADDSVIVRERIIEILSKTGIVEIIGQTGNGNEAVDSIVKLHPDVAIVDIYMPGKNGIEVLMKVKSIQPDTRVIMFTSYFLTGFREKCRKEGADFFLESNDIGYLAEVLGIIHKRLITLKTNI